jgi:uncharacterized MAPEG superfamily protein
VFGGLTGAARGKGGVQAPAISGDELFERRFRVHYNTLEQLVGFIPGLWAFATFVSAQIAAILGVVYLVGRILYFMQYTKNPASRGPGFVLSALPVFVLVLGGIVGVVMEMF